MIKKKLEGKLSSLTMKIAQRASGTPSWWGLYQPKEPSMLKNLKRK